MKVIILLSMALATNTLCSCYIINQGTVMGGYLIRARSVKQILGDPSIDEETKEFLNNVQDIRDFATQNLGLEVTHNYTTYVEIDRNYLATIVSASEPTAFDRYEWVYPVVGSLPYKGFFREEDARREGKRLANKGFDVWLWRTDAFSTLGYFRDPLYSYMKDYDEYSLANIIIHESVHATIFIKEEGQFNESLANFIGEEGSNIYIIEKYGYPNDFIEEVRLRKKERTIFNGEIDKLKKRLRKLYGSSIPQETMKREKEKTIAEFQLEFKNEYENLFETDRYIGFSELKINNAYLELHSLYEDDTAFFRALYETHGKSIPNLIAYLKEESKKKTHKLKKANPGVPLKKH